MCVYMSVHRQNKNLTILHDETILRRFLADGASHTHDITMVRNCCLNSGLKKGHVHVTDTTVTFRITLLESEQTKF